MWVARDPATGALAGRGGPQLSLNVGEPAVELGWVVHPERWGEGLATEIGRASIDVAARVLGVREVVAKTLVDNTASRRVMEKLGLRPEREIDHHGLPHVLYRGPARPTTPGPAAAPGA
jgi:RimJ/RimL family protein N-acetyltransferase